MATLTRLPTITLAEINSGDVDPQEVQRWYDLYNTMRRYHYTQGALKADKSLPNAGQLFEQSFDDAVSAYDGDLSQVWKFLGYVDEKTPDYADEAKNLMNIYGSQGGGSGTDFAAGAMNRLSTGIQEREEKKAQNPLVGMMPDFLKRLVVPDEEEAAQPTAPAATKFSQTFDPTQIQQGQPISIPENPDAEELRKQKEAVTLYLEGGGDVRKLPLAMFRNVVRSVDRFGNASLISEDEVKAGKTAHKYWDEFRKQKPVQMTQQEIAALNMPEDEKLARQQNPEWFAPATETEEEAKAREVENQLRVALGIPAQGGEQPPAQGAGGAGSPPTEPIPMDPSNPAGALPHVSDVHDPFNRVLGENLLQGKAQELQQKIANGEIDAAGAERELKNFAQSTSMEYKKAFEDLITTDKGEKVDFKSPIVRTRKGRIAVTPGLIADDKFDAEVDKSVESGTVSQVEALALKAARETFRRSHYEQLGKEWIDKGYTQFEDFYNKNPKLPMYQAVQQYIDQQEGFQGLGSEIKSLLPIVGKSIANLTTQGIASVPELLAGISQLTSADADQQKKLDVLRGVIQKASMDLSDEVIGEQYNKMISPVAETKLLGKVGAGLGSLGPIMTAGYLAGPAGVYPAIALTSYGSRKDQTMRELMDDPANAGKSLSELNNMAEGPAITEAVAAVVLNKLLEIPEKTFLPKGVKIDPSKKDFLAKILGSYKNAFYVKRALEMTARENIEEVGTQLAGDLAAKAFTGRDMQAQDYWDTVVVTTLTSGPVNGAVSSHNTKLAFDKEMRKNITNFYDGQIKETREMAAHNAIENRARDMGISQEEIDAANARGVQSAQQISTAVQEVVKPPYLRPKTKPVTVNIQPEGVPNVESVAQPNEVQATQNTLPPPAELVEAEKAEAQEDLQTNVETGVDQPDSQYAVGQVVQGGAGNKGVVVGIESDGRLQVRVYYDNGKTEVRKVNPNSVVGLADVSSDTDYIVRMRNYSNYIRNLVEQGVDPQKIQLTLKQIQNIERTGKASRRTMTDARKQTKQADKRTKKSQGKKFEVKALTDEELGIEGAQTIEELNRTKAGMMQKLKPILEKQKTGDELSDNELAQIDFLRGLEARRLKRAKELNPKASLDPDEQQFFEVLDEIYEQNAVSRYNDEEDVIDDFIPEDDDAPVTQDDILDSIEKARRRLEITRTSNKTLFDTMQYVEGNRNSLRKLAARRRDVETFLNEEAPANWKQFVSILPAKEVMAINNGVPAAFVYDEGGDRIIVNEAYANMPRTKVELMMFLREKMGHESFHRGTSKLREIGLMQPQVIKQVADYIRSQGTDYLRELGFNDYDHFIQVYSQDKFPNLTDTEYQEMIDEELVAHLAEVYRKIYDENGLLNVSLSSNLTAKELMRASDELDDPLDVEEEKRTIGPQRTENFLSNIGKFVRENVLSGVLQKYFGVTPQDTSKIDLGNFQLNTLKDNAKGLDTNITVLNKNRKELVARLERVQNAEEKQALNESIATIEEQIKSRRKLLAITKSKIEKLGQGESVTEKVEQKGGKEQRQKLDAYMRSINNITDYDAVRILSGDIKSGRDLTDFLRLVLAKSYDTEIKLDPRVLHVYQKFAPKLGGLVDSYYYSHRLGELGVDRNEMYSAASDRVFQAIQYLTREGKVSNEAIFEFLDDINTATVEKLAAAVPPKMAARAKARAIDSGENIEVKSIRGYLTNSVINAFKDVISSTMSRQTPSYDALTEEGYEPAQLSQAEDYGDLNVVEGEEAQGRQRLGSALEDAIVARQVPGDTVLFGEEEVSADEADTHLQMAHNEAIEKLEKGQRGEVMRALEWVTANPDKNIVTDYVDEDGNRLFTKDLRNLIGKYMENFNAGVENRISKPALRKRDGIRLEKAFISNLGLGSTWDSIRRSVQEQHGEKLTGLSSPFGFVNYDQLFEDLNYASKNANKFTADPNLRNAGVFSIVASRYGETAGRVIEAIDRLKQLVGIEDTKRAKKQKGYDDIQWDKIWQYGARKELGPVLNNLIESMDRALAEMDGKEYNPAMTKRLINPDVLDVVQATIDATPQTTGTIERPPSREDELAILENYKTQYEKMLSSMKETDPDYSELKSRLNRVQAIMGRYKTLVEENPEIENEVADEPAEPVTEEDRNWFAKARGDALMRKQQTKFDPNKKLGAKKKILASLDPNNPISPEQEQVNLALDLDQSLKKMTVDMSKPLREFFKKQIVFLGEIPAESRASYLQKQRAIDFATSKNDELARLLSKGGYSKFWEVEVNKDLLTRGAIDMETGDYVPGNLDRVMMYLMQDAPQQWFDSKGELLDEAAANTAAQDYVREQSKQLPAPLKTVADKWRAEMKSVGQALEQAGYLKPGTVEKNPNYVANLYNFDPRFYRLSNYDGSRKERIVKRASKIEGERLRMRKRDKWGLRVAGTDEVIYTDESGDKFFENEQELDAFIDRYINEKASQLHNRDLAEDQHVTPEVFATLRTKESNDLRKRVAKGLEKQVPYTLSMKYDDGLIMDPTIVLPMTLMHAKIDLENIRFLNDLADQVAVPAKDIPLYEREDPAIWRRVSDVPIRGMRRAAYGPLANKYIPTPVFEQVLQQSQAFEDSGWAYLDAVQSFVKRSWTSRNPATHFRNILSNALIYGQLAGLNPFRDVDYVRDAARLLIWGGTYEATSGKQTNLEDVITNGVAHADFSKGELGRNMRAAFDYALKEQSKKRPSAFDLLMKGLDKAGELDEALMGLYDFPDQVYKIAAYMKALDRGMENKDAAQYVRRYFPYYDEIPKSALMKWSGRFVDPFVRFGYANGKIAANILGVEWDGSPDQIKLLQDGSPLSATIAGFKYDAKKMDFKRIAAIAGAATALEIMKHVSAAMLGFSDKDKEWLEKQFKGEPYVLSPIQLFGEKSVYSLRNMLPWNLAEMGAYLSGETYMNRNAIQTTIARSPFITPFMLLGGYDMYRMQQFAYNKDQSPAENLGAIYGKLYDWAMPSLMQSRTYADLTGPQQTQFDLIPRNQGMKVARKIFGVDIREARPTFNTMAGDFNKLMKTETEPGVLGVVVDSKEMLQREFYNSLLSKDEKAIKKHLLRLMTEVDEKGNPIIDLGNTKMVEQYVQRFNPLRKIRGNDKGKFRFRSKDAQALFVNKSLQEGGLAKDTLIQSAQEFEKVRSYIHQVVPKIMQQIEGEQE